MILRTWVIRRPGRKFSLWLYEWLVTMTDLFLVMAWESYYLLSSPVICPFVRNHT